MAPRTSAAAYECAAAQSMDPWAVIKKASHECGGDTSSCPGPYPTAACPKFHVGNFTDHRRTTGMASLRMRQ